MRVLHTISSLDAQRSGGPAESVPSLAKACLAQDVEVKLVSLLRPGDRVTPNQLGAVPCRQVPTTDNSSYGYAANLPAALEEEARGSDVLHSHGLWTYINRQSARVARTLGRPHVISVRGMLEPWALQHHGWRKKIAGGMFQDRALREAACLHVLNQSEGRNLRALGLRSPVALIPNGVDLPQHNVAREPLESAFPHLKGPRWLLYLGRIHPQKGLLNLASAWARLCSNFPDHVLIVAGPEQLGHWAEVEQVLRSQGAGGRYQYTGMLQGELKASALGNAETMILPSYTEAASMALLEALAHGRPVVATHASNFPLIATRQLGLLCEPRTDSIAESLAQVLALSDSEREAMGRRGRELVKEQFAWSAIAAQMIELYLYLLKGGSRPASLLSGER